MVGFSSSSNDWLFHFKQLDEHVSSIISQYGDGKPCIVFCASKEGTQKLAIRIADEIQFLDSTHETFMQHADKVTLDSMTSQISEQTLSRIVHSASVAWHHAGMADGDRKLIETMFRAKLVRIVCCTTTLALGVNMPARLVVVRSSKVYRGSGKGIVDIDRSSLVQMVGRAGRFGMDTAGVAVVMTRQGEETRIEDMILGNVRIDSKLENIFREMLNTEIVLRTVRSITDAVRWIKATYYFQVMREVSSGQASDEKIKARAVADLYELEDAGCIKYSDNGVGVEATKMGTVMMRHSILLSTMAAFSKISSDAGMRKCLEVVCNAREFGEVIVRRKQKKWLNDVNWSLGRFKNKKGKERVQTSSQKIFQLCQALFGRINPPDPTLRIEMQHIGKVGVKVSTAMLHYFLEVKVTNSPNNSFLAPIVARLLRCFTAKCWEDDHLSQLKGVGPVMAKRLRDAGLHSIQQLNDADNFDRIVAACSSQGKALTIVTSAASISKLKGVKVKTKGAADGRAQIFLSSIAATDARDYALFVVAMSTGTSSRKLLLHKLNLNLNSPKVFTLNRSSIDCDFLEIYLHHSKHVGVDQIVYANCADGYSLMTVAEMRLSKPLLSISSFSSPAHTKRTPVPKSKRKGKHKSKGKMRKNESTSHSISTNEVRKSRQTTMADFPLQKSPPRRSFRIDDDEGSAGVSPLTSSDEENAGSVQNMGIKRNAIINEKIKRRPQNAGFQRISPPLCDNSKKDVPAANSGNAFRGKTKREREARPSILLRAGMSGISGSKKRQIMTTTQSLHMVRPPSLFCSPRQPPRAPPTPQMHAPRTSRFQQFVYAPKTVPTQSEYAPNVSATPQSAPRIRSSAGDINQFATRPRSAQYSSSSPRKTPAARNQLDFDDIFGF